MTALDIPPAYTSLDRVLPPGALVELPCWEGDSLRFDRAHFLHQLEHGRPIMDEVAGFPARYLNRNDLLAAAVMVEGVRPDQEVIPTGPLEAGVARLAADGFAGVVVDPAGYASDRELEAALSLLASLGDPVELGDRLVFVVPPGSVGAGQQAPVVDLPGDH